MRLRIKPEGIFQLKIALSGSSPLIWRRVLVPSNFSLKKLHQVIQIVMGWQNSHLYLFLIDNVTYTEYELDFEDDSEVKPASIKLSKVFTISSQFTYEYDFGDGWEHSVTLEKSLEFENTYSYPICIGGGNACPPEDCGGLRGYYNMLKEMKTPNDVEHESTKTWLGGFFDPSTFDPNRINRDMLWEKKW
ncbi:MAG: plasmid pRiA4b ORF-3 family protein [Pseudomonadota bacterium]